MNRILSLFLSMPFMASLLLIFALSCAFATFIENDFGIETAWAIVYGAWWFELIQVLLGINLIYNIIRFKLYKKDKIPSFLFHISFVFILVGSGLTRYFGYEGTLHIREGESRHIVKSSDSYIRINAYKNHNEYGVAYKKLISRLGTNNFKFSFNVEDERVDIDYKNLIPRAVTTIVDAPDGVPTIALTLSGTQKKEYIILREDSVVEKNGIVYAFNFEKQDIEKPYINFMLKDDKFYFKSNKNIEWYSMNDGQKGSFEANTTQDFTDKFLYTVDSFNFAPRYIGLKGKDKIVSSEPNPFSMENPIDAVVVTLSYKNKEKDVVLYGRGKGYKGVPSKVLIDDTLFILEWGSISLPLPFSVKLNDFQLERYPGSNSPSSYASEVTILDKDNNITKPYRIYMNNVLDYRGYRFFQASYDQDELGTILSVNKDPGKMPTYIGYFLLSLGLLVNILNSKSRFRKLASLIQKNTKSTSMKKTITSAILLAASIFFVNPSSVNANSFDTIVDKVSKYNKEHADFFGTILVQSTDGRIKPIDTLSRDILNKVYRSDNFQGLSSNQIILGMISNPYDIQNLPMIKVSHKEVKKLIGISEDANFARYSDFFSADDAQYKLFKYVEASGRKKDAEKNQFDKDLLKVDERLNILYYTYTLEAFKMMPKIADESNKWYSISQALSIFPADEAEHIRLLFIKYFKALDAGLENNDWSEANAAVELIKSYQEQYAKNIMPSKTRIEAELIFNKAKIFDRLTYVYLITGFILLMFVFVKMIAPKTNVNILVKTLFYINLVSFLVHTLGLGLRWFVAEHAPWSNGYESMIYIAWAIALAGLFFSKTSIISMSLTYIMAGITLFVAHLSWMDPQITNLMPVLKSYWLTIHVSVITASYGFLGLCSLLGFFVLILYILRIIKKDRGFKENISRNITEATRINEMSMILGLALLTIGNFLGGIWANESWGRYWGWDPKETWSLISILIYAAIVHLRFIPKLNNQLVFAIFSTIAYTSIIMTYFGVNYYLSGMHSYAGGDPIPVPTFIYWIIGIVFIAIVLACLCAKKDYKNYKNIKKL